MPLNPPANAREVARLVRALGTPLPPDVRHFFSIANGMEDYAHAGESIESFWSIRRILSDPVRPSAVDARGSFRDRAFADVMICSWFVCFRTRPGSGLSIHVEGPSLELPSLEAFFQRYLDDPHSLDLLRPE